MLVWLLNLIVPGAGLIVRRREWLGFSLAVVFALCANICVAGWLIAPASIPRQLTLAAGILTGLAWVMAQALLRMQERLLVRRAAGLGVLLDDAERALAAGDLDTARTALETAMALDDEDVRLHVLRARALERSGDVQRSRRAWRRVLQLDVDRQYARDARQALEALRADG